MPMRRDFHYANAKVLTLYQYQGTNTMPMPWDSHIQANATAQKLYKIRTIIYKSFNKDLIAKDRKSVNGVRKVNTLLNDTEVKKHLDIFLLRQSKNLHNVNDSIIKQYELTNNGDFIDD